MRIEEKAFFFEATTSFTARDIKDLELRVAGKISGTHEAGNIWWGGFELYIQLLALAVEKLKT